MAGALTPTEPRSYAVPIDELIAAARPDPDTLRETREPLDTAGLPNEFTDDAIRIAHIAAG